MLRYIVLSNVLGLTFICGCSINPYPHEWLDGYQPPSATPARDYQPSSADFLPKGAPAGQDTSNHEASYIFTEVFSDGSRKLYGNNTGSSVDYNSQLIIYPNNEKLTRLALQSFLPGFKAKVKSVADLTTAWRKYNKAATQAAEQVTVGSPSAADDLNRAYHATLQTLPPDKIPTEPDFTANQPKTVGAVSVAVGSFIQTSWLKIRQLRDQQAGSIGSLTITASLARLGTSKSTPLHISNYDNNGSDLNNNKGVASGGQTSTGSDTATSAHSDAGSPSDPNGLVSLKSTIEGNIEAVGDLKTEASDAHDATDPSKPADLTATKKQASAIAGDVQNSGALTVDPGLAPVGIIDLRDTPADRGDFIQIKATLSAPASGQNGATTTSATTLKVLDDPFDLTVDRLDWSLKLTGNMIFVNQIRGNSFTPTASAALSLHYHPYIGSEVCASGTGDSKTYYHKHPDEFWTAWNQIDPAIGVNIAALAFNSNSSSKDAGTNDKTSGSVEVGVGVQASVFNDLLQVGYGYDLQANKNPRYWFVGISVLDALNQIGGLGLTVKK